MVSLSGLYCRKIGIIKKADGKYQKGHNGADNIAVPVMFILISFLIIGCSKTNNDVQTPVISTENNPVISEQSSDAYDAKRISVDIKAESAYLWNISSDTVLYEKESNQRIAPASTAKMLTAITVLDYCDDDDEVLVGREIKLIAEDASRAWLNPGNRLTVRQLLHALLLPSGNDAAYALAVFTGKRIRGDNNISIDEALKAFIAAMNEKAADIGAVNSNFIRPDGYDADGQYTTALDLACIAREFRGSDLLSEIAGSYRISDVWLSGQEATYYNTNELINPDSQYYYECAAGLKTGKSEDAGCCLVSSAYIDDELYLCVVMGSTEEGRWTDSLKLYHAINQ